MRFFVFPVVVFFAMILLGQAKTIRLLTIGNSFSNNALGGLEPIVKAAGDTLIVGKANIGGCTLEGHAKLLRENLADFETGKGYDGSKKSLIDLLTAEKWDYISLQQASAPSMDFFTFQPYANELLECIGKYAPQAKIMAFQTWAYHDGHDSFRDKPDKNPDTMFAAIEQAYTALAKDANAGTIPAGAAYHAARYSPLWGKIVLDPHFDYKNPTHPNLPEEKKTLHKSYSWTKNKKDENEMVIDGRHANGRGEYLLGCVWYETLFEKSCIGNSCRRGVTDEEAVALQQIANETLEKHRSSLTETPTGK